MAFHVNVKNAPTRSMHEGRGLIHQLVDQEHGGSQHMDFHINVLEPDSGPGPYHYHPNSDNLYFILEGRARVLIEGQAIEAGAGEAVFIPAGEQHDVKNIGDGPLRLIEVKAPAESDFIVTPHPEA